MKIRFTLDKSKVLDTTELTWLYKTINTRLRDRSIGSEENKTLRLLSSKLWALDNSIAAGREIAGG